MLIPTYNTCIVKMVHSSMVQYGIGFVNSGIIRKMHDLMSKFHCKKNIF